MASSVRIGVSGSVDLDAGRVSFRYTAWLNDRDLRGDVETAVGVSTKIVNDATVFLV